MSLVFNAGAKLMQFATILVIGNFFGTGVNTDLYYFLFTFTIIISSFIGSIDATIVVPEFIRLRAQEGIGKAMGFVNKYIIIYLIIGVTFTIYGFFNPVSFYGFFSNFDHTVLSAHKSLLTISLVWMNVILVTNLLSNVLTSYKYFALANSFVLFNNFVALIMLLVFGKSHGIVTILAGITIGYVFNLVFLIVILKTKMKWNFLIISKSVNKGILKFTGTNQVVALIVAFRSYFVQYLLSGLNPGILTAVGWGNQFATLAESFLYTQFYTITGVRFSEYFALRQPKKAINLFYIVFNFLFLTGVVVFLMFFICSDSIIMIINFKHTFAPNIISVLSNSMIYLSLIPLINILSFLLVRLLFTFQLLNRMFLIYTIIGQVVLLLLLWSGIHWFGYKGYIIGSVAGFLFNAGINVILVKKNFPDLSVGRLFEKMYQPLAIATVIIAVGLIFKNSIHEYQVKKPILVIVTFGTVITSLYFKRIKNALLNFQKNQS